MGTASLRFDAWNLVWRALCRRFARPTGPGDCRHTHNRLWPSRVQAVRMQGSSYCLDRCLEHAIRGTITALSQASSPFPARHRIPLGLVLVSREQLTATQLRAALDAQRSAGRGRVGEWLQALGFAGEREITAALARQWSCPVLRPDASALRPTRAPRLPFALLQSFPVVPIDYVEATATLHLAFSEGVDYRVLHAIEQMLDCRTEPCLALPSVVRAQLESLGAVRDENEIVFDRLEDASESARIVRGYAARVSATEVRLAACGSQLWIRLVRSQQRPPLDLLLRTAKGALMYQTGR